MPHGWVQFAIVAAELCASGNKEVSDKIAQNLLSPPPLYPVRVCYSRACQSSSPSTVAVQ